MFSDLDVRKAVGSPIAPALDGDDVQQVKSGSIPQSNGSDRPTQYFGHKSHPLLISHLFKAFRFWPIALDDKDQHSAVIAVSDKSLRLVECFHLAAIHQHPRSAYELVGARQFVVGRTRGEWH